MFEIMGYSSYVVDQSIDDFLNEKLLLIELLFTLYL